MDTSRLSIKCSTTSATNAAQSESNSTTESLGPSTMPTDQSESIDTKVWVNDTRLFGDMKSNSSGFSTAKVKTYNTLADNVGRHSSGRGVWFLLTVSPLVARCGCAV